MPTPKDYLEKYVALRLLGLKTDPQSFGSTYEASLLLTEADWRARIDSIDKATFIASNSDDEWVGTMIIVSPEALITAPPHWTMPSNVSVGLGCIWSLAHGYIWSIDGKVSAEC